MQRLKINSASRVGRANRDARVNCKRNRIDNALDAAGNRTAEQVTNSSAHLALWLIALLVGLCWATQAHAARCAQAIAQAELDAANKQAAWEADMARCIAIDPSESICGHVTTPYHVVTSANSVRIAVYYCHPQSTGGGCAPWESTPVQCEAEIDSDRRGAQKKECGLGNPIYPLSGSKRETVNTSVTIGGHELRLHYDSTSNAPIAAGATRPADANAPALGALWTSSLHRRVLVQGDRLGALVARGDGHTVSFGGDGTGIYTPQADSNDRLVSIAGGYRFTDAANHSQETYDAEGRLTRVDHSGGRTLTFTYSDNSTPKTIAPAPGYLIRVQDNHGRAIGFEYQMPAGPRLHFTRGRISRIIDAAGQAINVAYDANENLSQLTWQDGSYRHFVYEKPSLPWALTGVIDELGVRKSTFDYDSVGRAISTEHAGGVHRYSVSYGTPPQVAVTEQYDGVRNVYYRTHDWTTPVGTVFGNPQGQTASLGASTILGKSYVTSRSQPAGAGCDAATSSTGYDANGNLAVKDDFNGNRVCYASDLTRNVETVRVEGLAPTASCAALTPANAALPAGSRKLSTQWHPDWRLETKIAEPKRRITRIYNGQPDPFNANAIASCAPSTALLPDGKPIAVLCKQVEEATTDANGSKGFSAALQSGVAKRISQWTYNERGQVLTAKDPLNNTTTYAYYGDTTADHRLGDLQSITNATAHVTDFPKYNAHGQVLQMVGANGELTEYTYDLRLRLLSVSVGGQSTRYAYDAAGQLTRVSLPDASFVAYGYDDAHRLVNVSDSKGNRIDYTLDASGKRIAEQVKDSGGTLAGSLTRVIDALGRVHQTTSRE